MAIKNNCTLCNLSQYRKNIVPGVGDMNPDFLFFGEAPGKDEDREGIPFCGQSGELLHTMIASASKGMDLKFFFINAILCRPTDEHYGDNRQPSKTEVYHCQRNVINKIQKVNPKNIIYIGEFSYRFYSQVFPSKYKLQHPAFILRRGGLCSPEYTTNLYKLNRIFKGII